MSKNRDIKQRELVLQRQEKTMVGSIPVYYCQLVVTSKKKGVAGRTDKNSGEIWFVYWGTLLNDVTLYSFNRSGFSGAWRLLSNFRDYSFPKDFARVFLSPFKIKKITINNLIGVSSTSRTLTYSKDNLFNPYHVTKEYGMVKNFITCVEEEKHSKLKSMLNTGKETALVTIQAGQIKLPLTVTDTEFQVNEHIELLFHIDHEIGENKDKCKDDLHWQFLDYMELIIDKDQKEKLDDNLRKEMFDYLKKGSDPSCFDPEATLWHHHQDTFYNCSSVKLRNKKKALFWSSNTTEKKGGSIQAKNVFEALNNNKVEINQKEDLKNISIQFWDEKKETVRLENMIPAQVHSLGEIDSTTGETKNGASFFKQGKNWFSVTQDWYFETTQRFVNAVKDCYYEIDDKCPEILPWNLPSDKKICHTKFTMKNLYRFCAVPSRNTDDDPDMKKLKQLREILVKDTQLFTPTGENNLLDQYDDDNHSTEPLLLNKSLIICLLYTSPSPRDS